MNRRRPLRGRIARCLALLLAASVSATSALAAAPAQAADGPPNLVLISLDNLGARHMGAYGYERDTTPFLDELAAGGVLFEEVVAQDSWTLPSHASLLTSRYVGAHGVWNLEQKLPAEPTLLPEALGAAGYRTAGFTTCVFLSKHFGFERGLDHLVSKQVSAETMIPRILKYVDGLAGGPGAAASDEPFFLFLHFYDVHDPFEEPNPYGEDFTEGLSAGEIETAQKVMDMAGRTVGSLTEEEIAWLAGLLPEWDVSAMIDAQDPEEPIGDWVTRPVRQILLNAGPEAFAHRLAAYDNGVAHMDHQLAGLFAEFARRPWFEDTVFVITSDHGESFNERPGLIGHGGPPYREQVHVPLIVSGPGVPQGVRVAEPVAGIDVAPTLLDLAGLGRPDDFQGRSLVPAFSGSFRARAVLTGSGASGRVALVDDGYKLLKSREQPMKLFTLQPEGDDLAGEQPDVVSRLGAVLERAVLQHQRMASELTVPRVDLDEKTAAILKQLGYLD